MEYADVYVCLCVIKYDDLLCAYLWMFRSLESPHVISDVALVHPLKVVPQSPAASPHKKL